MNCLFITECKKTGKSLLYWLYVTVLLATGIRNYDIVVESELSQTDNPASVFYTAKDGVYAESDNRSNEDM